MNIQQSGNDKKGLFYVEQEDKRIGTMTYVFAGTTTLIIEHTEVNPDQEGKGLGKLLVKAGVDFAREHGYKIIPLCPFAKSIFGKTPEYGDVLFG